MYTAETSGGKVYRFGEYRLCIGTRELVHLCTPGDQLCKRVLIEVEAKPFVLLAYLIEHRDRAVSKIELQRVLWDMRPLSDSVLSRCVMKARQALDDDGERQTYIRTIRGFGYRFTSEVSVETINTETADLSQPPGTPFRHPLSQLPAMRRRFQGLLRWSMLSLVAVAITVSVGGWMYLSAQRDVAPPNVTVIVDLLPVENATGKPALGWLQTKIVKTVEWQLSRIPRVKAASVSEEDAEKLLGGAPSWLAGGADKTQKIEIPASGPDPERCIVITRLELFETGLYRLSFMMRREGAPGLKGELLGENPLELAEYLAERVAGLIRDRRDVLEQRWPSG